MILDYKRFVESEENYPNIRLSDEEEEWAEINHIGIINQFGYDNSGVLRWQLYLNSPPSDLPVGGVDLE